MTIIYKTRTQQVVEILRERILKGELEAGQPLRQAALAEALNVSRIPVREALLQLEAEGLVSFEAHKGAVVTELSADQVDELFDLREVIEVDLLTRSIPNLTEEMLVSAEALLDDLDKEDSEITETSVNRWSEVNKSFHRALYQAADRPLTHDLCENLNKAADRYVRMHLMLAGGIETAGDEHRDLVRLCREKNIEEAVKMLRHHLSHAKSDIKDILLQQVNH